MQSGQQNDDVVKMLEEKLRAYKMSLEKMKPGIASKYDPAVIKKNQLKQIEMIEKMIAKYVQVPAIQTMDKLVTEVHKLFSEVKKYARYFKENAEEVKSWTLQDDEKFVKDLILELNKSGLLNAKKKLQESYRLRDITNKLSIILNRAECTVHKTMRDNLVLTIRKIYHSNEVDSNKLNLIGIELANRYREIRSEGMFGTKSKLAEAIRVVLVDGIPSKDISDAAAAFAEKYVNAVKAILDDQEFRARQSSPKGMARLDAILASNDPPLEKYAKICAEANSTKGSKQGLFDKRAKRTVETNEFYKVVATGDIDQIKNFNAEPAIANKVTSPAKNQPNG